MEVLEDQDRIFHHGHANNHPLYIFIPDDEEENEKRTKDQDANNDKNEYCFHCTNCNENMTITTTLNTNIKNNLMEICKIISKHQSSIVVLEKEHLASMTTSEHDHQNNIIPHDTSHPSSSCSFRGLINLGNTCYMNSALQTLFRSIHNLEDTDVENDDFIVSIELSNLFKSLSRYDCNEDEKNGHYNKAISPHRFLEAFAIRNGTEWRRGLQQDSHEFIRRLFNNLDDEKTKKHRNLFAGKVKHTTCCEICMKNTHIEELFMDLSLPLQQKDTTLENLLSIFEEPIELKHENSYACENCKKLCPATRQSRVIEWPLILMIHLERFALKRPSSPSMGMFFKNLFDYGKLHDHVSFRPFMTYGGQRYNLIALIVHEGYSADYGHYISYTKNNHQWYYISDSNVQSRNLESVTSSNPYLLFYEKTV